MSTTFFFFTPRYSFYISLFFFFFRGVEDSYSSVDLSAYHFAPCVVYEAVQVDLMNGDIQRRWFVRCWLPLPWLICTLLFISDALNCITPTTAKKKKKDMSKRSFFFSLWFSWVEKDVVLATPISLMLWRTNKVAILFFSNRCVFLEPFFFFDLQMTFVSYDSLYFYSFLSSLFSFSICVLQRR